MLASLLTSGCGTKKSATKDREEPAAHFQRGVEYLRVGRPDQAIRELETAVSLDRESTVFRNFLGLAYYGIGDLARAQQTFEELLILDPYFTEAHNNLGIVHATAGNKDRALVEWQLVLRDPRYQKPEVAKFNMGKIHHERGDSEQACVYFGGAVTDQPDNAEFRYYYGSCLADLARDSEAETQLQMATELRPNYSEALFRLGEVSVRLKRHFKAKEHFQRVIQLAPGSPIGVKAREYLRLMD